MLLFAGSSGVTITGNPTVTVWIDWDDDGTFSGGDDITADVSRPNPGETAIHIDRGGAADFGSGLATGSATISVRNDTDKYTPENAGGTLYGKLRVGRRVWIVATYGGQPFGLFAGRIKRIVPDPVTKFSVIVCDDPIGGYDRQRDAA